MFARHRAGLAEALGVSLPDLDGLLVRDGSPAATQRSPTYRAVDLKQLTLSALVDYRQRDSQSGGRELYQEVLEFLSGTVGPYCFGAFDSGRAEVFSAAASVCEMAGWMAFEAGFPKLAERHFDRAHDHSSLAGDAQLTAHISASRSHLATETGFTKRAGLLAQGGRDELAAGPPAPELRAKLLAYEARSAATAGQVDRCHALMTEAETHLARSTFSSDSPWLSPFDEASLANELARCCLLVGDYSEAIRQAESVVESRPPARVRSRVFAHLAQAQAHAARGDAEQARFVAAIAADEATELQSAPVDRQLDALATALSGCAD